MTLSPGAKVQPNLSTLRSPAGFNAACSSMLRERAPTTTVHRAENLDIADRIETEPARDAAFHKLYDARNRGLGIGRLDKIEAALGFRLAQIGRGPLVDAVGDCRSAAITRS
jgi:hypothetical protein